MTRQPPYKMNQATVSLQKRLSKGVSMGANYQYMHAIDDASSVNGGSGPAPRRTGKTSAR